MNRQQLLRIVLGVGLIVALVAGFLIYRNNTSLLLTSTDPSDGGETSITSDIAFTFNHPLDEAMVDNFSLTPYTPGQIVIEDNRLVFEPSENLQIGAAYEARLSSPRARNGLVSDDAVIKFRAVYVPFNELSEGEQEAGLQDSNSLEAIYPIVQNLPYETLEYKIDYLVPNFAAPESEDTEGSAQLNTELTQQPLILEVTLYATLNRPDQYPVYRRQLRTYRQNVLEYIRSLGYDPADYDIRYTPDPDEA